MGISSIWVKATSSQHGRILRRVGAHHVVYPDLDAGKRTAHLVGGRMVDYIEMEKDGFSIMKLRPPREVRGFSLEELDLRSAVPSSALSTRIRRRASTPTTRLSCRATRTCLSTSRIGRSRTVHRRAPRSDLCGALPSSRGDEAGVVHAYAARQSAGLASGCRRRSQHRRSPKARIVRSAMPVRTAWMVRTTIAAAAPL